MGGAGDSPAPVGDPPTGTALSTLRKGRSHYLESLFPFRPSRRRTEQAGRLCFLETIFQARSQ